MISDPRSLPAQPAASDGERSTGDSPEARHRLNRVAHWDGVARAMDRRPTGRDYHRRLAEVYRHLDLAADRRCSRSAAAPATCSPRCGRRAGVGVDFSGEMLARARAAPPRPRVRPQDARMPRRRGPVRRRHPLGPRERPLGRAARARARPAGLPRRDARRSSTSTAGCGSCRSRLAERLGLARPVLRQNWLTPDGHRQPAPARRLRDAARRSRTCSCRCTCRSSRGAAATGPGASFWPFRHLALTNFVVARPLDVAASRPRATARLGHRPGAQRGGQHRADLRAHARDGRRDGAHLRRGALDRRHLRRDRARDRRASRSGAAGCCGRPARARATPSASGSPRLAATC